MSRVRIKICGITNAGDARAAIAAGADALGINFFPGSKRHVNLGEVEPWLRTLPPLVSRIALMVNPSMSDALAVAKCAAIDAVQLHGDESPEFCSALICSTGIQIIKAIPLRARSDFEKISEYEKAGISAVLVDAHVPGEFGGTGRLIDLDLAAELAAGTLKIPLILSGGLNPGNVADAIYKVRPYAVDVASGVEGESPRRKDFARMNAFVAEAQRGQTSKNG